MVSIKINEVRYNIEETRISGKKLRELSGLDGEWIICMKRKGIVIEIPDNAMVNIEPGEKLFSRIINIETI